MPRLRERVRGAVPFERRGQAARMPEVPQPQDGAAVLRLRHEQRFGRQVRGFIRRLVRRMPPFELRGMRTLTRLPIADCRLRTAYSLNDEEPDRWRGQVPALPSFLTSPWRNSLRRNPSSPGGRGTPRCISAAGSGSQCSRRVPRRQSSAARPGRASSAGRRPWSGRSSACRRRAPATSSPNRRASPPRRSTAL